MADITQIENALYEIEDFITVSEAIQITGVTRQTLITWCAKYKVGKKIGGRWYINPEKLALLLKGEIRSQKLP